MSRNEKSSFNKAIKRIFLSTVVGAITYMLVMLFLSLLVYKEAVAIETAEKYLSKVALIPASFACCMCGNRQGREGVKYNFISASIMLAALMFASAYIERNLDFVSTLISALLCYTGTILMSIATIKNSKMHKRNNFRKRNITKRNHKAELT